MQELNKENISDFMDWFITINYIRSNNVISIDLLNSYLNNLYKSDVSVELKQVIGKLVKKKILERITNYSYLVKINNIPLKGVILNDNEYINYVISIVDEYNKYVYTSQIKAYEQFDEKNSIQKTIQYTKNRKI